MKLIAIGECGVGKSTIGNFFLRNDWDSPFVTSSATNSCTQTTKWVTVGGRSFCDTPGIPDTNRLNNIKYYDMIIKCLRRNEFSAILFVFKYGKKDNDNIARSKALLREIFNSGIPSVLVINDQRARPGKDEEYLEAARELTSALPITFSFIVPMNARTIEEKITETAAGIAAVSPQPVRASPIKTFGELGCHIEKLIRDKALVKEEKILDVKKEYKSLKIAKRWGKALRGAGCATSYATGVGLIFIGAIPLGAASIAASFVIAADADQVETKMKAEQEQKLREILKLEKLDVTKDEDVVRLRNHYEELCKYLYE